MKVRIDSSDFPDGDSNVLDLEKVPADCTVEDLKIDYEGLDRIENYIITKVNRAVAENANASNKEKLELERQFIQLVHSTYIVATYRALNENKNNEVMTFYCQTVEKRAEKVINSLDTSKLKIPMYAEIMNAVFMVTHMIFLMPYLWFVELKGKLR